MRHKIISLFVCVLALAIVGIISPTSAQETRPRALLTWRAHTYAQPEFSGKALPITNSSVTVALDIVDQGNLVDLSGQRILWYVDGNLVRSGTGLTKILVTLPSGARGTLPVRVSVPDYRGGTLLGNAVSIPVASPKVVIRSPFIGDKVRHRGFTLEGIPYFFNVDSISNLRFSWEVNDTEATPDERPDVLVVTLEPSVAPQTRVATTLRVTNPQFDFETVSGNLTLTFTP